jgi:hypothetical protein
MTETERNGYKSVALLAACVAIFGVLYALEMDLGRWDREVRVVRTAFEASMRYVGIAHFILAAVFTATSARMRVPGFRGTLALLVLAGAALATGYGWLRGRNEFLAGTLFVGYFFAHDFRDQVFFYFRNGDAPEASDPKGVGEALFLVPYLFLAALASVLACLTAAGVFDGTPLSPAGSRMPAVVRAGFILLPLAVVAAAVRLHRVWQHALLGSARRFLSSYRPLAVVFGLIYLVLLVGLIVTGRAYAAVLFHATSWWIFVVAQLRKKPASAKPLTWAWMRGTPLGFSLLHAAAIVFLLGLGAVWAYGFRNDPAAWPFSVMLGKDNFPFWTIVHVTVSLPSR